MKKETKLGIVIVVSLILFIYGLNYLKGKDIFNEQKVFYTIYDRIDGLSVSNPVQINGYKIGQVSDIHFHPNNSGKIVVQFFIKNINIKLPSNTKAKIISSDLLGSKAIALEFEELQGGELKDGDTLVSAIQESLQKQVSNEILPLKEKAQTMMASIDSVMSVIQAIFNDKTKENIDNSISKLKMALNSIEHTTTNLDTLVSNEKSRLVRIFENIESISLNLKNNNEKITHILSNLSNVSDTLAKAEIASTINKANDALTNANSILEDINSGKGTIGQLISNDSLYNELESASKNLDLLLEDMRLNPNRYVHFSVFGKNKPYESPEEKEARKAKKAEGKK